MPIILFLPSSIFAEGTDDECFLRALLLSVGYDFHVEMCLNSAGTGLLSMMAARAMGLTDLEVGVRSEGMVTACESYLPMFKLMRKVLRANGMDRKIRVINKRSDELEVGMDIPFRADVLVS